MLHPLMRNALLNAQSMGNPIVMHNASCGELIVKITISNLLGEPSSLMVPLARAAMCLVPGAWRLVYAHAHAHAHAYAHARNVFSTHTRKSLDRRTRVL